MLKASARMADMQIKAQYALPEEQSRALIASPTHVACFGGMMVRSAVVLLLVLIPLSWSQSLPDAPSAGRVADKKFWAVTGANGAFTFSDALTTSLLVGKGSRCPYEVGSPGLYGEKAPAGRVVAVMGSTFAASVAASYFLKKYDVRIWKVKLWMVPQIYNARPHVEGTIHNLRFCR